jgi:hypothetical protein
MELAVGARNLSTLPQRRRDYTPRQSSGRIEARRPEDITCQVLTFTRSKVIGRLGILFTPTARGALPSSFLKAMLIA